MARRSELERQARQFAEQLTSLLNATVTDGPRLRAVLQEDGRIGWIGFEIERRRPFPGEGIPLTISASPPRCFLHVMQTLTLDPDGGYLVVQRSSYGLYLEQELATVLFHYDYDRDPEHEYPLAHLQVNGQCPALDELNRRTEGDAALERLHFPVGGKRYRPSLEDVVEFLVIEGFVRAKDGWRDAVEQHRRDFHRTQLMAATRRDPEAAAQALAGLGYRIELPTPS